MANIEGGHWAIPRPQANDPQNKLHVIMVIFKKNLLIYSEIECILKSFLKNNGWCRLFNVNLKPGYVKLV